MMLSGKIKFTLLFVQCEWNGVNTRLGLSLNNFFLKFCLPRVCDIFLYEIGFKCCSVYLKMIVISMSVLEITSAIILLLNYKCMIESIVLLPSVMKFCVAL